MNSHELVRALTALSLGRQTLVDQFRNEEPKLYRPMFMHSAWSNDMNIAIDKFMLGWIVQHPTYYKAATALSVSECSVECDVHCDGFLHAYRRLCEMFVSGASGKGIEKSHFIEKVVMDSVEYLDKLLILSGQADEKLERLRYHAERSRSLFDRALKEAESRSGDESD